MTPGAMSRLRQRLRDALDPSLAPGPVKSFKDTTAAERAELQRLYGAAPKTTTQEASGNADSSRHPTNRQEANTHG